jgi:glycerol kinase
VPRYWLGIDQGSTATKVCLMDRRGKIQRFATRPIGTILRRPGWAEHDAESILRSVQAALDAALRGVDPGLIAGAGLACQRSTFVIWDPRSGRPLTPALSWQDRRGEEICAALRPRAPLIRRRTGLRLSPHYAASKIRWIFDRSPGLRRRAEKGAARIGTLDAFLLFRLTGGEAWSTDPTHAARTLLMDLRRLEWDPELLDLFRIPLAALPPIRPSAFPAGEIAVRGGRLRIAATVGDQQAALLGVGCRRAGEAAVNYGTGAFVVLNSGRRARRVSGLLTSVAWSSFEETRYLVEGTVNSAGGALGWIENVTGRRIGSLGAPRNPDRLPCVVPAFAGLGAPHWLSRARGAIFDLDLATTAEDLAAGTMAGVACRVGEIVQAMVGAGMRPRRIVAGGGLAEQAWLLDLQGAILRRRLVKGPRGEAGTGRGAAILAGHARGDWNLESDRRLEFPTKRCRGRISFEEGRRLAARFQRALGRLAGSSG